MTKNRKFSFLKLGIREELRNYKEHTTNVESLIQSEIKKFQDRHTDIAKTMEEYEAAEYLEFMSEQYWERAEKHPEMQRKAELISSYTILENGLVRICSAYERSLDSPILLSDLAANGIIDKSKKYLEKVARIAFPSQGDEWEEIKKVQQIRNAFVHNSGIIKPTNTGLINYLKQSKFIDLKSQTKLKIKSGFTIHCLNLFENLFDQLFKEIENKSNKALPHLSSAPNVF